MVAIRHRFEVVEPAQERDLVEPTPPGHPLDAQNVESGSAGDFCDAVFSRHVDLLRSSNLLGESFVQACANPDWCDNDAGCPFTTAGRSHSCIAP